MVAAAGITAETAVETIAATVSGTTAKEATAAVTPMKAADAHRRARQPKTGMRIAVAI